ncbi:hypothetical protein [Streptomyces triculaminicus]|uniref:hypothetical protein n=1 Tax=Streptomyces triculaminicus TaxID=2816232 RepID=UPI0037D93A5D
MKRVLSGVVSAALLSGALITGTAGTASAATGPQAVIETTPPVVEAAPPVVLVDPIGEQRTMCTYYHQKNACASLLSGHKMSSVVQNCLVKAGIGGAGAFIVGKYVSKDVAKDIAAKVVTAGATACLASLS